MRIALVVSLALALTACKKSEPPTMAAQAPAPGTAPGGANAVKGKVVERIDAAPYSYLRLSTPSGEIWAAVPQTTVANGTDVTLENPMAMDGFESKTLNRKFDKILFATLAGAAPAAAPGMPPAGGAPVGAPPAGAPAGMPPGGMPPGMAAQHAAAAAGPADVGEVKVAKATGPNAKTIAEVYGQKGQLKEKVVAVRGKVVKYNSGIMGKNWIHLRDGTGAQGKGDNDITVTTGDVAAVGDVIIVTGTVRLDKDFGAGYAYPVIIEEATIAKK
ncbi:MAG TPA: OB-fold nucleic acid binding domain-containing protein [Anaeromyxobacteraceae bacterium]|nr:OB-fold nucleic acid binding domain-containing protein [Anaeromyxobacteraceae bacterium]